MCIFTVKDLCTNYWSNTPFNIHIKITYILNAGLKLVLGYFYTLLVIFKELTAAGLYTHFLPRLCSFKRAKSRRLSITSEPHSRANEAARRRSVAKVEVWLSLRVAAIQRQWLKRLDCERLHQQFLWNLNYFGTAGFLIHRLTTLAGHLLGLSGDYR